MSKETEAVKKVKEVKGKNWFLQSYLKEAGFANLIELRKAKVAESKLKREFASKYDRIVESIISKGSDLLDMRSDVANFKLELVLGLQQEVKDLLGTSRLIKDEFLFLFSKEMKVDNDVEEALTEALGEELAESIIKG